MGTIKERAKEYAQAIYGYAPAIEIAFIRGARSEHEELTCWRDPKCPPAHRKPVLIKGVTPSGRKCLVVGVFYKSGLQLIHITKSIRSAGAKFTNKAMDILTPHDGITNEKICKAQIEAVEKKQNEYNLIGRLTKVPGHTLYKFNTTTREASKAEMRTEITRQYDPDTDTVVRHVKSDVKVERTATTNRR